MSKENEFTPKLGRIGNRGVRTAKGTLARLKRSVARSRATSGSARRTGFKGHRFGRGAAIGALSRTRKFARSRRVVVKVHIARTGSFGNGGFARHVGYITRDGTERDGSKGVLYDKEAKGVDAQKFNQDAEDDRRQFRIILSPEDGHELTDMKETTREFMAGVERDLGVKLDWVAVDHHNTAHPHTHIVIRSGSPGAELVIAKDYITHGMRARAEEVLTNELGLRREHDIARSQAREVSLDRFTSIDHVLARDAADLIVIVRPNLGSDDRFDYALKQRRLGHLQTLGIAEKVSASEWHLSQGWEDALRSLGKRDDIIRTLSSKVGERLRVQNLMSVEASDLSDGPLTGSVAATGPGDELRNGRMVIIDGLDGRPWAMDVAEDKITGLPKLGGIIELKSSPVKLKPSDRTIIEIAKANTGIYSDALHSAHDPGASTEFRLAHKRRLEALRRAGISEHLKDGRWRIPGDYADKVLKYEAKRSAPSIVVRSWLSLEALIDHSDAGWLDQLSHSDVDHLGQGFGQETKHAFNQRRKWLTEQGWIESESHALRPEQIAEMKQTARVAALRHLSDNTKLRAGNLKPHTEFTGLYQSNIDLPQGRFAVLQNKTHITLVPWRAGLARHQGKALTVSMKGQRVSWQLARTRARTR